jgi:hypothetical protein
MVISRLLSDKETFLSRLLLWIITRYFLIGLTVSLEAMVLFSSSGEPDYH